MPTFSFFFLVLISHATTTCSRPPLMKISEATRWSSTRRQLGKDACRTGNPIDDCWRCDPDWETNRKVLADCAIGFGRNAVGGRDGSLYVVTNSDSDDPVNPVPGTLRYGVIQEEPLWIIFDQDMVINLKEELVMNSHKTIDGRGHNIQIADGPCITIRNVSNIIIHNIYIHGCVPGQSAMVRDSTKHYDAVVGSTSITVSNNYMFNHDEVMLLGHSDDFLDDKNMQVTIAFNFFGENLVQRMPSESLSKCIYKVLQVTWRERLTGFEEWKSWNWRSDGDMMINGAFFTPSGQESPASYIKASSMVARPASYLTSMSPAGWSS
ncbi:PECTATE LYASE 18-RELATED [Salix purpurea]|uniref:Pectate lyase n=1 Tax=Salix purpurea TaxID=77065 RepID=A0A9Q1AGE2_SALPP|nr:PECTATE LYASE 18-RELATED [Salix purpurea]